MIFLSMKSGLKLHCSYEFTWSDGSLLSLVNWSIAGINSLLLLCWQHISNSRPCRSSLYSFYNAWLIGIGVVDGYLQQSKNRPIDEVAPNKWTFIQYSSGERLVFPLGHHKNRRKSRSFGSTRTW